MTLTVHLNNVLDYLTRHQNQRSVTTKQLISCIDLTLLEKSATNEALRQLCSQANKYSVAAVCVYPSQLKICATKDEIRKATVINFPFGNEPLSKCLSDMDEAIQLGADEIDYVFPYSSYLSGEKDHAVEQCLSMIQASKNHNVMLKIILETGSFPDMSVIYNLSKVLAQSGCNFIKTSTGKSAEGATLSSAFAILSAIKDSGLPCGIKISGGVRTTDQAYSYAYLAELILGKKISHQWFRIGASSLLGELLKEE